MLRSAYFTAVKIPDVSGSSAGVSGASRAPVSQGQRLRSYLAVFPGWS
jgi:hypothetical protein